MRICTIAGIIVGVGSRSSKLWKLEKYMKDRSVGPKSVKYLESNMVEMRSALIIRTKKCHNHSWAVTETLV